jgi:L-arabinose isomerase
MFMHGMQAAFGAKKVGFTEIFSVGYKDNRLVVRHWGDGNMALARSKPAMKLSTCNDEYEAKFPICDFEYKPGPASLVNLTATGESHGQVVSISGSVEDDHLPKDAGPRCVFKPDNEDVSELLNEYSYLGGSHHMAIIYGQVKDVLSRLAKLTGWEYHSL